MASSRWWRKVFEPDEPGLNHPAGETCGMGCPGMFTYKVFEPDEPGHNHPASETCEMGCPNWLTW